MARDVSDDTYYITRGGKIPVRWTAPEVWCYIVQTNNYFYTVLYVLYYTRHYFTRNFHLKVMCGVLDV